MWALRRKLYKTLTYDERDNPTNRRILKEVKRAIQKNICVCGKGLPEKNAVLDRFEAMKGYTEDNTRLICPECNVRIRVERGYKYTSEQPGCSGSPINKASAEREC
jgi:hypothetical protein